MDSQKVVTPANPGSWSGTGAGVQEIKTSKNTGFRLESIPHLMRDRNDSRWLILTFYEFVNFEGVPKLRFEDGFAQD